MALAVPHSKFSFLTRGLVEPLCVLLHCPGEGVIWSMCSHFSYAFNAVCIGFELQEGALASLPCSIILSVVSISWRDVSCSSYEGAKLGMIYVTVLMVSLST